MCASRGSVTCSWCQWETDHSLLELKTRFIAQIPTPISTWKVSSLSPSTMWTHSGSDRGLDTHDSGSWFSPLLMVCPCTRVQAHPVACFIWGRLDGQPHFPFPSWALHPSWDLFTSQRWMDSSHQLLVITCTPPDPIPLSVIDSGREEAFSSLSPSLWIRALLTATMSKPPCLSLKRGAERQSNSFTASYYILLLMGRCTESNSSEITGIAILTRDKINVFI